VIPAATPDLWAKKVCISPPRLSYSEKGKFYLFYGLCYSHLQVKEYTLHVLWIAGDANGESKDRRYYRFMIDRFFRRRLGERELNADPSYSHNVSTLVPLNMMLQILRSKTGRVAIALLCLLVVACLLYTGIIWPNSWFVPSGRAQGLDVSVYQKQIDWKQVAQTGKYAFVFIKASEGKHYQDPSFQANWRGAKEQGLLHGAYHYFTTSASGADQAANFVSLVPKEAGMLPPVLDIEVNGQDRQSMVREIGDCLDRLERYYGLKPIIYTMFDQYSEYIKGQFEGYPLWIRGVFFPIQWSNVHDWTFWQYNDRGHVSGISEMVDLNVFSGKREKLKELAHP
jgi:lysozyme